MKQLMTLHQKQGTHKHAAAGWLAAIYALRAADRLDAGAQWGRIGDEIIDDLEWGYRQALGNEAEKGIEVGHKLLETHHKPQIEVSTAGGKKITATSLKAMQQKAAEAARAARSAGMRKSRMGIGKSGVAKPSFAFKPGSLSRRPMATRTAMRPMARPTIAAKPAVSVAKPVAKKAAKKGGKKRA
ncbi:MAG TPA: hypothetical protein VII13_16405 [Vicinamibacteria bacterium]